MKKYGAEPHYRRRRVHSLGRRWRAGWDVVRLMRYPDRKTFGRMVADPEYRKITHPRLEILIEAVLQPNRSWACAVPPGRVLRGLAPETLPSQMV